MADNNDVLRCPLCHGHGELRRAELEQCFAHPEFRAVIEGYLARFKPVQTGECDKRDEGARAAEKTNGHRDFQTEVHRWNPESPIFRRSPKE